MRIVLMAGALIVMASVVPVWAGATGKSTTSKKQMSDSTFVMNAATANLAEIELGKLAETRASSDQVKTFARRMINDHQKALDRLKTVATTEKVTLPTSLDAKDQALKDRLAKLSGKAFDQAYMSAMVKDHRADVAEFRAETKRAKSPEVRQYASTTLPTLEDHFKLAQSTDQSVSGQVGQRSSSK